MWQAAFSASPLRTSRLGILRNVRQHTCRSTHVKTFMRDRSFWVLPNSKTAVTTALEANITHFVFTDPTLEQQCSTVAQFSSISVNGQNQFQGGVLARLTSAEDVEYLMQEAGRYDTVIIDPQDWKQIPAENLIAAFQPSRTKLFAVVNSAEEALTMFSSLQAGVDGCVLRTSHHSQIAPFAALKRDMQEDNTKSLLQSMVAAKITSVTAVGVGHRVCIDTCSILSENEGLMVGSSSQALYLILSEAAQAEYCPSRPFRVNAGPVHAYCLVPGGKTRYLVELEAGDSVIVVNNDGTSCRTVIVGRAKIETRPLLMIETSHATEDGQSHHHNVFLQNAETVRVATVNRDNQYGMTSVSALNIGDHLLMRTDAKARHIGMPIEEYLIEK